MLSLPARCVLAYHFACYTKTTQSTRRYVCSHYIDRGRLQLLLTRYARKKEQERIAEKDDLISWPPSVCGVWVVLHLFFLFFFLFFLFFFFSLSFLSLPPLKIN